MDDLLSATVQGKSPEMANWLGITHHGDCLQLMPKLPSDTVDIIVTSPPYNIKNSTGNGLKNGNGGKWPQSGLIEGYDSHDDAMPHDDYVAWQRSCLSAMMSILKPTGAIFYNHKWRIQGGLLQDRNDIVDGFPVRQIIIWKRAGGINFNPTYFLPTYEVIYLIAKPDFTLAPKANAQRRRLDDSSRVQESPPSSIPCRTRPTLYRVHHRICHSGPVYGIRYYRYCCRTGGARLDRHGYIEGLLRHS